MSSAVWFELLVADLSHLTKKKGGVRKVHHLKMNIIYFIYKYKTDED